MRITHVTHRIWPVAGGSERYVLEVARRQVAEGHDVTIVASTADALSALWSAGGKTVAPDAPDRIDGVRLRRVPVRSLPLGEVTFPLLRRLIWWAAQLSPALALRLGRLAPWLPDLPSALACTPSDLLFAWNITLEGLTIPVAAAARAQQVPWIAVPLLHLARPRFYTMPHQLALLGSASRVLVQTPRERACLVDHGLAEEKLSTVSPGVTVDDAAGADGDRLRRRLGLGDRFVVTTLGALGRAKGTLQLIGAAHRLWEAGTGVALVLVGPAERSVARAISRLPEAYRRHCYPLGRVDEATKWDAVAASDLVVLPSRTESFGIVFLEAWLLARPVIGSDAGAIRDVIEDGVDGVLVPWGDAASLAAAIAALVRDPERRHRLGARGREKVLRGHTWEFQYNRLREVVRSVMEERSA